MRSVKHTIIFVVALLVSFESYSITTFNVTNTNDVGAGSLRQAIIDANATANSGGNDIIDFSGLGAGTHTIVLASDLPSPTEPVTIDGFTATSYAISTPVIGIDGFTHGFLINNTGANGSIIRGLVIWGCSQDGFELNGVSNITISGCWIGLDLTGALPANHILDNGIYITNIGTSNTIGGAVLADRNVISGCDDEGIFIDGTSTSNTITYNYIGVGTTGLTDIGNGQRGIRIESANNNIIGGAAQGNIISGNGNHGILLTSSTGTVITTNYIGVGSNGVTDIGNDGHGINLDASSSTTIGGSNVSDRNVISGNGAGGLGIGITIINASNNCIIRGNYIGTNFAGSAAVTNDIHGININNSTDTQIGGDGANDGNLISGNTFSGINIDMSSDRTIIRGNKIGTNTGGTAGIPNLAHGIFITNSDNCTIGGTTLNERNLISENGDAAGENGISITNCNNHTIKGNFVGVTTTGLAALPNNDSGLSMTTSTGNTIGGASVLEKNVFSGNANFGIFLNNVDNSTFSNNFVGCDSTGNAAIANGTHGIHSENDCSTNSWSSNFVSGNTFVGLDMLDIDNHTFTGNYIGLGKDGVTDLGNGTIGLRFGTGSSTNTIGGSTVADRNYISGNGNHGFFADGISVSTTIIGNYFGSDTSGLVAVGNNNINVFFLDQSANNVVGTSNAGEGNLICCSLTEDGIRSQVSTNTDIMNNIIGLNINGEESAGFGNDDYGIWLMSYGGSPVNDCQIGGLGANEKNFIAHNGQDGVRLSDYGGFVNQNPIIGNKIFCNGGEAINHEGNTANENEGVLAPVVTSSNTNDISGTGTIGNTIHVYYNVSADGGVACNCEGELYRGTTVVDGAGNWTITHNLGLTAAQTLTLTATQTNATNSTSEMWACSNPMPVTYGHMSVQHSDGNAILSWTTVSEENNDYFQILRSTNGSDFHAIGTVQGNGNSDEVIHYSFTDFQPISDQLSYYKIIQYDNDGTDATSKMIVLPPIEVKPIYISTGEELLIKSTTGQGSHLKIYSINGQLIDEKLTNESQFKYNITNLSSGVYMAVVHSGNAIESKKFLK